jgi:hypothetical protein
MMTTMTIQDKKRLKNKYWRINHLYKIRNKAGRLIQFKLNEAQNDYYHKAHTRNLVLKSRQLGFTTLEAIDSLDDVLWNRNFNALMLSYDKESALEIFDDKVSLAWENYPEEFKSLYTVDTDRTNKLKFGFGDKQFSSLLVRTRARSGTFNRIHTSEFAKVCKESLEKAKEFITGTIPAVPYNGRLDIESTAEGETGAFHDMFWEAWNRGDPENNLQFKAHFYNWTWDKEEISNIKIPIPFYQMDSGNVFKEYKEKHKLSDLEITYYYQKWQSLNKDWKLLHQEYPTTPEEAFITSGYKLFDQDKVDILKKDIHSGETFGGWTFYDNYKPNHYYVAGFDVAEGVGQDSSTGVILDLSENKVSVVAVFSDNTIAPDLFAYEIKNGCTKFGNCLAGVERNNHGHAVLSILKNIYENIYKEEVFDKENDEQKEKLGWHTTGATKPKMLYDLATAINDNQLIVPDKRIITELRTYDKEDISQVRFNEDQSRHWDLVIALAISWQMRGKLNLLRDFSILTSQSSSNIYSPI